MKAIQLHQYGDVDELMNEEAPRPKPGPGEVLVQTMAASINPVDWKVRKGERKDRWPLTFPAILGRDVVGRVIERGEGVTDVAMGARVIALTHHTHAEFVIVRANDLAVLADGLDDAHAAALPLVALTGAQLVEEHVAPRRGDLVLVTGALGGVGRSAVHVLKEHGARVIAGVRKSQKDEAKQLGVESVVALDDDTEIAALPIVDAIADTVGAEVAEKLLAKVKKGGIVATTLAPPKGADARGVRTESFMAHPDGARLRMLAGDAVAKKLEIPVARTMRFTQVREAMRLAERGAHGKVVLVP